jgi:predicted nucleic acid-binding protein
MRVLLDTNILYNFLFETPLTERSKSLLSEPYDFYISTLVLNELFYSVIRRKAEVSFGIRSYRKLKEFLNENGYKPFLRDLSLVESTIEGLGIVRIKDSQNWELIRELMLKYSLLPSDATILATAIENGLDALATFDGDYSKVQEMKILP